MKGSEKTKPIPAAMGMALIRPMPRPDENPSIKTSSATALSAPANGTRTGNTQTRLNSRSATKPRSAQLTAVTTATIRPICAGPSNDSQPPTKPTTAKAITKPRAAFFLWSGTGDHTHQQPISFLALSVRLLFLRFCSEQVVVEAVTADAIELLWRVWGHPRRAVG